MDKPKKVGRVSNYRSKVEWILRAYQDNEEIEFPLIHAFQKEAIQNSTGARSSNDYKDWRCEISVSQTSKGKFLIVEDFGTCGLTGNNYTVDQLKEMVKTKELENKPDERLARISCDNVSGSDQQSAGLFGVGKTMYIATSSSYTYYFESITKNEGYRCNINEEDQMFDRALEEEEARMYIKENTGLDPICHIGARFIILDPSNEIVESITGSDEKLLKYVEETWWRIINRLPEGSGIFVQGKKAGIPKEYDFNESENVFEKNSYFNKSIRVIEPGYKVKKVGFFLKENLPDYLCGFYFYRRGMKICSFNIRELEPHIPSNYVGFIEVDQDWENELAKIENHTHYGIIRNAKNTNCFQYLQRAVKENIELALKEWGYLKDKTDTNKELRELVDRIKEDVIDTLTENGYENIGKGDKQAPFEVRLSNVAYPHPEEKGFERSVFTNDEISFDFSINNKTYKQNKYVAKIVIRSADGSINKILEEKTIVVAPTEISKDKFFVLISGENAVQNSRNTIVLSIFNANGTGKTVDKKLPFYFGIETEIRSEEDFKLDIKRHDFPRVNDRRVNTGEWINNIQYSLENNLNKPVKFYLSIYSLNAEDNNDKIEDISKNEYIVPPFGEICVTEPIDVCFSRDVYIPKLNKGVVKIRAALILGENIYEKQMGKSKKIDDYTFDVYFNKPEKSGLDFPYDLRDSDKHLRSWIEGNNTVVINTSHPEFSKCDGTIEKSRYIALQYLRQVIFIYAKNGTLDKTLMGVDGLANNVEFYKNLDDIIEGLWYKQCQK